MKTKKQIKAREATKRQRKARKKHAYKSIFCDGVKVVKKKPFALIAANGYSEQKNYGGYPTIYKSATKNKAGDNEKNIWRQAYDKTIADSIDFAVNLDFDGSGEVVVVDLRNK